MKKSILVPALFMLSTLVYSCNNENSSNEQAEEANEEKFEDRDIQRDADFAVKAASGGLMEVRMGELALSNANSEAVRDFGRTMIQEHGQANEELKALAQSKNITLPEVPDNDKLDKVNKLAEKRGAEFDEEYMELMVRDHKDDIDLFKDEADNGNDPDIKQWAAGKVPVLERHLQMAESIKEGIKNKK